MIDLHSINKLNTSQVPIELEDGSFGGYYQRPDNEMLDIWQTGVEETRAKLESGW